MAKFHGRKKNTALLKTRKELRKENRLKKKENKRQFFCKSNKPGKYVTKPVTTNTKQNDEGCSDNIDSDFDLSDEELKNKLDKFPKNKKAKEVKKNDDRFHEKQQREKKQQADLQKKMRKRRMEQLKAANEEDDMIIRRYGKKLKIDKHKSEKSVHKMFNDGLHYALELCLPENIKKMYEAAKEAADLEDSADEFEEDMAIALGDTKDYKKRRAEENLEEMRNQDSVKTKKKVSKLSKIEKKYFEDDLESQINGSDSEFYESEEETDGDDSDPEEELHTPDSESIGSNKELQQENSTTLSNDSQDELSDAENSIQSSDEDQNSVNKEVGSNESCNDEDLKESEDRDLWEDIYGRKRDKEGHIIKVRFNNNSML